MRLFVSTALALAAASLVGLTVAGVIRPSPERPGDLRGPAFSGAPATSLPDLGSQDPTCGQPALARPAPRGGFQARAGTQQPEQGLPVPHEFREFYFTRAVYTDYNSGFWRRRPNWAIDYPKADCQFLVVLKRLIDIDAYGLDNAVRLDDPALRRYPFLYALEVGRMDLTDGEVQGLRGYLEAGGFLVIDDFWGSREWANFEYQMSRVLPGRSIEVLEPDHPVFNMVYDIEEIVQVPNVGAGVRGGPTMECLGCLPEVRGIHDDHGRLMVVVNWNTDLGDAWEWAENPYYPLEYSTFAYEMGVNMIVYGMSH